MKKQIIQRPGYRIIHYKFWTYLGGWQKFEIKEPTWYNPKWH